MVAAEPLNMGLGGLLQQVALGLPLLVAGVVNGGYNLLLSRWSRRLRAHHPTALPPSGEPGGDEAVPLGVDDLRPQPLPTTPRQQRQCAKRSGDGNGEQRTKNRTPGSSHGHLSRSRRQRKVDSETGRP
jgi:hypothetical protein